jgi:protein-disulfide isomerase
VRIIASLQHARSPAWWAGVCFLGEICPMKQHISSAIVAVVAVALALAFFFAGFFVRGWVDRELVAAVPITAEMADPSPPVQGTAAPAATPTADISPLADIGADDDPARGPADAPVTIIEFSDYQCPFCKRYVEETLPLILDTYGDRVRYVFRDFPIGELHPQAAQAAQAAQCAFDQGKFWEYHDLLFGNQGALDVSSLKGYAGALGLDQAAFDRCLDSAEYAQEVQDDFEDARAHGVTGVPTFFINGRKLVGAASFASFQTIIEEELRKTNAP